MRPPDTDWETCTSLFFIRPGWEIVSEMIGLWSMWPLFMKGQDLILLELYSLQIENRSTRIIYVTSVSFLCHVWNYIQRLEYCVIIFWQNRMSTLHVHLCNPASKMTVSQGYISFLPRCLMISELFSSHSILATSPSVLSNALAQRLVRFMRLARAVHLKTDPSHKSRLTVPLSEQSFMF